MQKVDGITGSTDTIEKVAIGLVLLWAVINLLLQVIDLWNVIVLGFVSYNVALSRRSKKDEEEEEEAEEKFTGRWD